MITYKRVEEISTEIKNDLNQFSSARVFTMSEEMIIHFCSNNLATEGAQS